jgi:COP9 signalosome complex subunit 2
LAKTLNIDRTEAESLVVGLILDEKIKGRIDQVQGVIVVDRL